MSVIIPKDTISGAMHGRGGFPVKTLIYATFILLLIYMFYIYSSSQSSLREAEMTGSRYKREVEERVTEIQDLMRSKDRVQEACQNEKTELHNRIKSLNQQYSMVQSQYKETNADFIKLRQDIDTMRAEHAQADSSHAAEYEKLKQEKDNDIAKLKDEVADLTRQSQNLENTITNLRQKVKENEVESQGQRDQYLKLEKYYYALQNSHKHLVDQNAQLQQQLQNKIQSQQPLDNKDNKQQQIQNNPPHVEIGGQGVTSNKNLHQDQFAIAGQHFIDKVTIKADAFHRNDVHVDDGLNNLNQVQPPNNNNVDDAADDDGKKVYNNVHFRPEVNPNDEQKAQILEPVLEHVDKHQGGGEDGVVAMNARHEEEAREKNVREEEDESLHHKNPLALGQIELPKDLGDLDNSFGHNKKNVGQQLPPLINDENEQKEQDRGENHYFGEDEDAQQQQQQQEERHHMEEEEERDEANDFDNNVDRFGADLGNKPNKADVDN